MNKSDLKNIEMIIRYRQSEPIYVKGGDYSPEELENMSTDELKALADDFNDSARKKAEVEIKQIVDEMFQKYAKEGDNMVVLSAAYFPEHEIFPVDDPLKCIDFGREERWNKLYYPIDCNDDEYKKLYSRLENAVFGKLHMPYAEEEYEDDNDALNEYWYGVIGIMKDYRIVKFVIRYDGLMCDNDDYVSFHNKVIYEIKQ